MNLETMLKSYHIKLIFEEGFPFFVLFLRSRYMFLTFRAGASPAPTNLWAVREPPLQMKTFGHDMSCPYIFNKL